MSEVNATDDADDEEALTAQFEKAEEVINDFESGQYSSADLQGRLCKAISALEKITRTVSMLGIFSNNEEVEDLPTSSIPFLLIPCYLGVAHHNTNTEPIHRLKQLRLAKAYYRDFLRRLQSYGFDFERGFSLNEEGQDECTDTSHFGLKKFNGEELRERKIARFRKQKELKIAIDQLKRQRQEDRGDDAVLRQLHLTNVKYWQGKVIEELESIEDELPLVEMMNKRIQEGNAGSMSEGNQKSNNTRLAPLKPFIIARSEQQKAVFGLGYPSIPTMTVDEWYNQQFGDASATSPPQHRSQEDKDLKASSPTLREEDDDDERERARLMRWDEYKDDHRRGWGNTHNKG